MRTGLSQMRHAAPSETFCAGLHNRWVSGIVKTVGGTIQVRCKPILTLLISIMLLAAKF